MDILHRLPPFNWNTNYNKKIEKKEILSNKNLNCY